MADFVDVDPRNVQVFFEEKTWTRHVIVFHSEVGDSFEQVCMTLKDPDVIIANNSGYMAKKRTGEEAYIKQESTSNSYIMVPTKTTTEVHVVAGTEIPPGAKMGLTAYRIPTIPPVRRLWTRKT